MDRHSFRSNMSDSFKRSAIALRNFLNTSGRNIELDFVRGIAILLVIGYHALKVPTTSSVLIGIGHVFKTFGWTGVDLFFVLSGFLVGGLLLREYWSTGNVDPWRFIIRRGFKIWPPYYFYILFQVIAHRHPIRSYLVANLLHVQNYIGSSLEHTWTLSLEEHFYLLLSLGMALMASRKWSGERLLKALVIAVVVVGSLRCLTWYLGFHVMAQQSTHSRIDSLLIGVILAAMLQFFPRNFEYLAERRMLLAVLVVSALGFVAIVDDRKAGVIGTIGFSIIYLGYSAFMLLAYRHSGAFKNMLVYRLVAKIGVYSYGIYLWHLSVRDVCVQIASHFGTILQWPVAILLQYGTAIVLGAGATHLIEWPFIRMRDRLFPAGDRSSLVGKQQPRTAGSTAPPPQSKLAIG
jgi:peptidoglycan/LPS O-acetylase OafA/YrhL